MASKALIQGEALVRETQGFQNNAAALGRGFDQSQTARKEQVAKEEAEVEKTQGRVNSYMASMKSDIDFTNTSPEQQKAMKNFLVEKRGIYADAANNIAKIGDATDPEYQRYADIMTDVNRSFANLSTQMNSYKEGKVQYGEDIDSFSGAAANASRVSNLASIYNLDPEGATSTMNILPNGDLSFNTNGEDLIYNDLENPILMDFDSAKAINATTNEIFERGVPLTEGNKHTYRTDIKEMLLNDDTLQSILSPDFSAKNGLDFSDIVYDPENLTATREAVTNRMMQGWEDTANEGYKEKQRMATAAERAAQAKRSPRETETIGNRSWIADVTELGKGTRVQNIQSPMGNYVDVVPAGVMTGTMTEAKNEPGMMVPLGNFTDIDPITGKKNKDDMKYELLEWAPIAQGIIITKKR